MQYRAPQLTDFLPTTKKSVNYGVGMNWTLSSSQETPILIIPHLEQP